MKQYKKVSVILRNWNGKRYLKDCLSSLKKQTYPNFEIIFVDDGSTDGSVEFVQENFPSIKLITNEKPDLGCPACSNIGIMASRGEYIATLDIDTEAEPDWLEKLANAMESEKNIGMCGSKVLSFYDHRIIDFAGHLIYKDFSFIGRGLNEIDNGQYDNIREIFGPMGASALYRRTMLMEIGLFDTDYYTAPDDFELAWRGRIAGWKCLFVPDARVYHVHSAIQGAGSLRKAYYHEKNRPLMMIKNAPLDMIAMSPIYTLIRYLTLAKGMMSGKGSAGKMAKSLTKKEMLATLIKAWGHSFLEIPQAIKKRRKVQTFRKVSRNEMKKWFKDNAARAKDIALKVDKNINI
ncbi:MAG: glycosyltransferase family 2 protein [Candidatus Methanoperedens sp.]|nr:glycosyltransferase family 2 protein [Candidatus Methanoperedens sp.]